MLAKEKIYRLGVTERQITEMEAVYIFNTSMYVQTGKRGEK
jgi:hypothetical protein